MANETERRLDEAQAQYEAEKTKYVMKLREAVRGTTQQALQTGAFASSHRYASGVVGAGEEVEDVFELGQLHPAGSYSGPGKRVGVSPSGNLYELNPYYSYKYPQFEEEDWVQFGRVALRTIKNLISEARQKSGLKV